jgi:hypothetical protein
VIDGGRVDELCSGRGNNSDKKRDCQKAHANDILRRLDRVRRRGRYR